MDHKAIRVGLRHVCAAASVMVLAACSSVPTTDEGLPQLDLTQALAQARSAQESGDTGQAEKWLEQAARAHPGAKEPWLRRAQVHLEARRYGQAIVAAQEVLQRDVTDTTAHSIMAVAGLRSSALALGHLRERNAVQGSAREEAQSLALIIREAVGEPLLVAPQPQAESPPQRPPTGFSRRRDPGASPASRTVRPSEEAPARPAAAGGRNPFSALQ